MNVQLFLKWAEHGHGMRLRIFVVVCGVFFCLFLVGSCRSSRPEAAGQESSTPGITISSPAIRNGFPVPKKYSCEGENISPPLAWVHLPGGTKSVVLLCEDPDAPGGTFTHWILYGLPAMVGELPENMPKQGTLYNGARQGTNDFGGIGYGGPCPPPGHSHRYYFRLFALAVDAPAAAGLKRGDLLAAMKDHVLAEGQLMGTFKR